MKKGINGWFEDFLDNLESNINNVKDFTGNINSVVNQVKQIINPNSTPPPAPADPQFSGIANAYEQQISNPNIWKWFSILGISGAIIYAANK